MSAISYEYLRITRNKIRNILSSEPSRTRREHIPATTQQCEYEYEYIHRVHRVSILLFESMTNMHDGMSVVYQLQVPYVHDAVATTGTSTVYRTCT